MTCITAKEIHGKVIEGEVQKILINTVIIRSNVELFLVKKSTLKKQGYKFDEFRYPSISK
ncbi:hypothetical protein CRM75_01955 [Enterococcus faecium]|nr:hypothetical protein CRM75_01955 [Enterococcus faecium]